MKDVVVGRTASKSGRARKARVEDGGTVAEVNDTQTLCWIKCTQVAILGSCYGMIRS